MDTITDHLPPAYRRVCALAERDPRRAVALARACMAALPAGEQSASAWPAYTLGWSLLYWERFDEARRRLTAARAQFAAHGHALTTLRCDFALLLADFFEHAHPDLEQQFEAIAAQFEQQGASVDATRARLYLAGLFNTLGRPREAEALLDRIEPELAQGASLDAARALYVRGTAAIQRGDYRGANAMLAQAERAFTTLRSPLERAKCWFQQSWAALRQEKLEQALTGYRRAERSFTRLSLPIRLAFSAKNIGLLLTRLGKYDDALRVLLQALRSFAAAGRVIDIAGCHLNLGNIYFYIGMWDTALAYYTQAEALYSRAGVVSERIIARRNRAMIYRTQGYLARAHTLLDAVEAEAQAIGDQAELAAIWMERAGLLDDADRYEQAEAQYRRAAELFAQHGDELGASDCHLALGWMELRHGDAGAAEALFQATRPRMAQYPPGRWRADYGLARCAELRGDVAAALSHYRAALATVAELRQRLASEVISSSLYTQAAQLHSDSLHLAVASGALDDLLSFSESQRALVLRRLLSADLSAPPAEYQRELEELRNQIVTLLNADTEMDDAHAASVDAALARYGDLLLRARHSPAVAMQALDDAPELPFDLAQLRAQFALVYGSDWTALVYIRNEGTLLIVVVTPEALGLVQTPYDGALQTLIERASLPAYRRYTYYDFPFLQGHTARRWAGLHTLAERLLPEQVRARLHPDHRLLIVPSEALHMLPWATLRLEAGWLAEQAIIHLLPSLTVWQSLYRREPNRCGDALLVGCSSFGAREEPLPQVSEELASVAARWPGGSLRLEDADATRAALLERAANDGLERYGLLHIASHAQLLPGRGLAAHVKLWDDDLWLPEIADLRIHGALVVLSACDGATADTLPGGEILSLSWAFLSAGAIGILASLWKVYDRAAYQFMEQFYDALRQHGDSGLALAQTQRALIAHSQGGGDAPADLLNWGSFVLIGNCHLLR